MKLRGTFWSLALAVLIGAAPLWAQGEKNKGGDKPPAAGPGGGNPGGGNPGGGNPGGGNPGGGRGNPPQPPKVDRPAPPKVDRPAPPKVDRPAPPKVDRPAPPKTETPRPMNPGADLLPGRDRPANPERPAVRPDDLKPQRPARPDIDSGRSAAQKPPLPDRSERPSTDRPREDRPKIDRPSINRPDLEKPGIIDLPIRRPGTGDRPGIGDSPERRLDDKERPDRTRPGTGDRPDNDRPNFGDRSGNEKRPDFARPERHNVYRPDRPAKPIFNDNQFVNGSFKIGVQPNRPAWGVGQIRSDLHNGHWHNNNWGDHWQKHYVNNHYHDWYHGPWQGSWGANSYSPTLWAGARYGVGSWWLPGNWGYGRTYYNPYYVVGSGYDYSQPVVINQYVVDDSAPEALRVANRLTGEERAFALFDEGLELFKAGSYPQAYARIDEAQRLLPGDPVLHEVKALSLFAIGRYDEAAAVLNALLASSPGMDWSSMNKLYGDERDYTAQLRRLETYAGEHPRDAGAIFVLAYHYLVIGEEDSAARMLKFVVARQPDDLTARRMLDGLTAPAPADVARPERAPPTRDVKTELVGEWIAKNAESTVQLIVEADGGFTWRAAPKGKEPVTVSGSISANGDSLALESKEQGTMLGKVTPLGPNQFNFLMGGSPSGDPGLDFERR